MSHLVHRLCVPGQTAKMKRRQRGEPQNRRSSEPLLRKSAGTAGSSPATRSTSMKPLLISAAERPRPGRALALMGRGSKSGQSRGLLRCCTMLGGCCADGAALPVRFAANGVTGKCHAGFGDMGHHQIAHSYGEG
jgi:hypothetical protein